MKNKTIYYRTPKEDGQYPFFRYDAQLLNLPNDQLLIMFFILSNNNDWVINSIEIQSRLQKGGTGARRYKKAMRELQKKKYLVKERILGGVIWKVYENPNYSLNTPTQHKIQRAPKPKEETKPIENKVEEPKPPIPATLTPRQKSIMLADKTYYLNKYNVDITTLNDNELILLYQKDKSK